MCEKTLTTNDTKCSIYGEIGLYTKQTVQQTTTPGSNVCVHHSHVYTLQLIPLIHSSHLVDYPFTLVWAQLHAIKH